MVQLWYPARAGEVARRPYLDGTLEAYRRGRDLALPVTKYPLSAALPAPLNRIRKEIPIIINHLSLVMTNAASSPPIFNAAGRFPVVVFSHGYGVGVHSQHTTQAEALASHGYIVVGINHTFGSYVTVFPDGRVVRHVDRQPIPHPAEVEVWAADIRFVIDQLESLADEPASISEGIDVTRIGFAGFSFGGTAALAAASQDARLRAGVVMDGDLGPEQVRGLVVNQPVLFMFSAGRSESDGLVTNIAKGETVYRLDIAGTEHFNFSDMPLLSPVMGAISNSVGPIDGRRALEIVNAYTVRFFDNHLAADDESPEDDPSEPYPEASLRMISGG